MLSVIPVCAVAFAAVVALFLKKQYRDMPGIFLYLTFVLPFAAGGFHSYVSAVTAVGLIIHLYITAGRRGYLRFTLNINSIAVLLVLLGYCITPMWAADKGMAVFGILRYLPAALYALALMQLTKEQKGQCLSLIPISGAAMTVLSGLMLLIPGTEAFLTVNGRLAGFLQYPNTYAAFLLGGLILQYSKDSRSKWDLIADAILVLGIILSGSKTVFVLLVAAVAGIAAMHKKTGRILMLAALLAGAVSLALVLNRFDALRYAGRFRDIRLSSGSFLVRLLYYKDALPMILKNPFGYGYLGYRALEGTFQTGGYYVTYLHNGLLQLLFEIGWLPALAMAAAFLRAMFSRKNSPGSRLLLFSLLAHCMLDFDLQFFLFWVILLTCLDFEEGTRWTLRKKTAGALAAALCMAVSLWLGVADLAYSVGKTDLCLVLMPAHTDALSVRLRQTSDAAVLNETADQILKGNPTHSLAYSAKANAALSQGDVLNMMAYKERAILCSRYTAEEYMDYFDKLYGVRQVYRRNGDTGSAEYCERKMVQLYEKIQTVQNATDPLTDEIGEYMRLELPIRYRLYMRMLWEQQKQ